MSWKPRRKKWDWRSYLTADERAFIVESDKAAAAIERQREVYRKTFARKRQIVVNRAVQRAKFYGATP